VSQARAILADWISEENLRPFLTALSWIVRYRFDDGDWTAISLGVSDTNGDTDRWYDYEFAGELRAQMLLARDRGSGVIRLRLDVPHEAEESIKLALAIFQHFRIQHVK
jgi:hypothetical protein